MEARRSSSGRYEVLGSLGEGAYGVVLKCINKETGQIVAVKKFKEPEGVQRKSTLREVKLLRKLKQANIVNLLEAFRRRGKLYLVFEYVETTLLEILERNLGGLPQHLVLQYTFQLLKAVQWCHLNGVVHRDIKPENLLITDAGMLKLCDFGFARSLGHDGTNKFTPYVATRWYRAPELLVGMQYGSAVDVWSVGAIMAEMADGDPLFPGESDIDQLYVIQRMLGPLPQRLQQAFSRNPQFQDLHFPAISDDTSLEERYGSRLDRTSNTLLQQLLTMDPNDRPTAEACVQLPIFAAIRTRHEIEEQQRQAEKLSSSPPSQAQQRLCQDRPQPDGRLAGAGSSATQLSSSPPYPPRPFRQEPLSESPPSLPLSPAMFADESPPPRSRNPPLASPSSATALGSCRAVPLTTMPSSSNTAGSPSSPLLRNGGPSPLPISHSHSSVSATAVAMELSRSAASDRRRSLESFAHARSGSGVPGAQVGVEPGPSSASPAPSPSRYGRVNSDGVLLSPTLYHAARTSPERSPSAVLPPQQSSPLGRRRRTLAESSPSPGTAAADRSLPSMLSRSGSWKGSGSFKARSTTRKAD